MEPLRKPAMAPFIKINKFTLQTKVALSLLEKPANKDDPTPKTIIKEHEIKRIRHNSLFAGKKIPIMLRKLL